MPESGDKATTRNVAYNRYMMAKKSGLPKYDFSPKNFAWVMRRELAVVALSICFGMFILPKWQRGASQSAAREQIQNDPNKAQQNLQKMQNGTYAPP